jgi:membrane protease YdiL (CAAX protease family)
MFGLFHIGNKKTIPYGIYACLIGFLFGFLYHLSNNLFLPIAVHILNNFIALNYIKYYYAKKQIEIKTTEA